MKILVIITLLIWCAICALCIFLSIRFKREDDNAVKEINDLLETDEKPVTKSKVPYFFIATSALMLLLTLTSCTYIIFN